MRVRLHHLTLQLRALGGAAVLVLLAGSAMTEEPIGKDLFLDALRSAGPLASQADKMALYAPLIGDWAVDVIDYGPDGSRRTSTGEWHFAWVLEGRAIQDVWIAPRRALRQEGTSAQGNRYGTTVRVYDPKTEVWTVNWFNPVTGARNTLVGRKQGDDIIQEGTDSAGVRIRWTFSEITATSFYWRGEVLADAGKTWRLVAEFRGRRDGQRKTPAP